MGTAKKLLELILDIDKLDENNTIYANKPWSEYSKSIVLPEPKSGQLPNLAKKIGADYFIEVFLAKEFMNEWEMSLSYLPTIEQKCQRLIQYVINDA